MNDRPHVLTIESPELCAPSAASTEPLGVALSRLSQRERAVLRGLMDGKTAEEMANEEFVAISTVRTQIQAVLRKLGVKSQLAAVTLVYRAYMDEGPLALQD